MADAPDPTITSLKVTIDRVEAHINGQWLAVATQPKEYDLLSLVKNSVQIGSANLPTGHYTQVRLFPSSATVTDSTGTHTVTIPSGLQTGIKLNVDYDITEKEVAVILLDFNLCKSLIKLGNGNYKLQPVIPVVVKVLSGTVTGTVTRNGSPQAGASVKATYTAGPNYAAGTEVNETFTLADGTFKVWALLPGTYTVTASFTDASNVTTTATATNVTVVAGSNADVGTLMLE
jgi:hypothetical protein